MKLLNEQKITLCAQLIYSAECKEIQWIIAIFLNVIISVRVAIVMTRPGRQQTCLRHCDYYRHKTPPTPRKHKAYYKWMTVCSHFWNCRLYTSETARAEERSTTPFLLPICIYAHASPSILKADSFYRYRCLYSAKWWWYIFCFYFVSLIERLWIYLTKACKFWGKWGRSALRNPWWWGLSSKDVPNEAFREKGFVMWRTCYQLQAVASKAVRCVCVWYPNSKMAIVKQSNRKERQWSWKNSAVYLFTA